MKKSVFSYYFQSAPPTAAATTLPNNLSLMGTKLPLLSLTEMAISTQNISGKKINTHFISQIKKQILPPLLQGPSYKNTGKHRYRYT